MTDFVDIECLRSGYSERRVEMYNVYLNARQVSMDRIVACMSMNNQRKICLLHVYQSVAPKNVMKRSTLMYS